MMNKYCLALVCMIILSSCRTGAVKSETVTIYKHDGSISCDKTVAIAVESMKQELTGSKIPVISSGCGTDGIIRAAVCGIKTGDINIFEVRREMLPKAQALGFTTTSNIQDFVKMPCP